MARLILLVFAHNLQMFPDNRVDDTGCNRALLWALMRLWLAWRAGIASLNGNIKPAWPSQDSAPWDSDLSLWDGGDFVPSSARVILGSANTKLYMLDATSSFDGVIPNAYLERRGLSFGTPETVKLVRGVRPRIQGNTGATVQIQIGSQDDPFTEPVWGEVMAHTIGQTISNDCLISGRYIAIRFSTGTAYQWRLDSVDLDIQQRGVW